MPQREIDELLERLALLWSASGAGLRELFDRLEDLAARRRLLRESPEALDQVEVRARSHRFDLDRDELRRLAALGFSEADLAVKYDCSPSTIHNHLVGKFGKTEIRLGKAAYVRYRAEE
jgi:hypothetical protein